MKTITRKSNNVSLYYISDDTNVDIQADQTIVGPSDNPEIIILDCNSSNCTLHTSVPENSEWFGNRYLYNGSSWSINSSFKGSAELLDDINDEVTTITLISTNALPSSGKVQIEDEKISYTGKTSTELTGCTRGVDSTTPNSHRSVKLVEQI